MTRRRVGDLVLRYRLLVLLAWSVPFYWLTRARVRKAGLTDWVGDFEFGARALIRFVDHRHHYVYESGGLHLYVNNPSIQIGPPPLVALAAFQWLPVAGVTLGFTLLMVAMGPLALACVARCFPDTPQRRLTTLLAGLVTVPFWAYWLAGSYRHLDDVFALTGIAVAMLMVARERPWLMALFLGTAVASKPWAVVAVPLLLGLRRENRAKALLATLAVAGAWWGPFVLAAPDTITSLGGFGLDIAKGSVLHALGLSGAAQGWLRPVQFDLGLAAAAWVALKKDWRLAPLAGLAVRVLFDPFAWEYYGAGPLLVALAADLYVERRVPVWTLATAFAFYGPASAFTRYSEVSGAAKAVWVLGALLLLLRHTRTAPAGRTETARAPALASA